MAISLSGAQSCPSSGVLQLMSTAAAGSPALSQRKRSICTFENRPPVMPAEAFERPRSWRMGAHFMAMSLEVLNGLSRASPAIAETRSSISMTTSAKSIRVGVRRARIIWHIPPCCVSEGERSEVRSTTVLRHILLTNRAANGPDYPLYAPP
jgi:hypothetical protein